LIQFALGTTVKFIGSLYGLKKGMVLSNGELISDITDFTLFTNFTVFTDLTDLAVEPESF